MSTAAKELQGGAQRIHEWLRYLEGDDNFRSKQHFDMYDNYLNMEGGNVILRSTDWAENAARRWTGRGGGVMFRTRQDRTLEVPI
jgi:hypothetical protein